MPRLSKILPAIVGGAVGKAGAGRGLLGAGVGLVAARIARKSVPGALLVGGAMVAKWLYDKKQEEKAAAEPAPVTPPPANP
jgi:hypothetical protein